LNIAIRNTRAMPKKRKPATPRRPAPKPLPEPLPPNPPPIPVRVTSTIPAHLYEVRPRKDKRGVDLISGALPFGRLWYDGPNAASNATAYAKHYSRSHDAVIRVYDEAGNVIETHEHAGDFKEA
jgi:hypothetical protein